MAVAAGVRLGPYEITGLLGEGGMAEVYRALDTRLDRVVAVKMLPADVAQDARRLARFAREAKAIAAVSHPGILAIYDVGEHEGTAYTVTELLSGETLRDRLAAGPLPQRKAVEFAAQVATGLAAAHERGIVHRDIKPANLFLTAEGRLKILDFGLAAETHAVDPERGGLPTETEGTTPGTVLGTVGYMSPEQAAGLPADARSDVFSLGCVLYEMLSGRRAFARETAPETMTAILREDPPPLSDVRPPLPDPLRRLVLRCVEKRPEDRFQSARDLAFALDAFSGSTVGGEGGHLPSRIGGVHLRKWSWAVATTVAAAAIGSVVVFWATRPGVTQRATFVDLALPPGVRLEEPSFARLSPDGRRVVVVGADEQARRLWLRDLDSALPRPLPAAAGGWPLGWSRDGRRITFVSVDAQLKELDVDTGSVASLGVLPKGVFDDMTGTWNEAGDLVFSMGGLLHRPRSGGRPTKIAMPDVARGELLLDAPQFLQDGRHYVFGALGTTPEQAGVYVGDLGSSDRRLLLRAAWLAMLSPGHLLFQRGTDLFAQRFDQAGLLLLGESTRLLEGVYVSSWRHPTAWVAANTLAFVSGPPQRYQLTWFDRAGRNLGLLGEPAEINTFDLSPDGSRVVQAVGYPATVLWLIDPSRGASVRLANGIDPRFSGDGKEILFGTTSGTAVGLQRIRVGGGSRQTVLTVSTTADGLLDVVFAQDWSKDGRFVLYTAGSLGGGLWSTPISGESSPRQLLAEAALVDQARFSPDGKWVAYNSDVTGRVEVFVIPFPPTGERWQVSAAGGVQPMWRADGRELFYLDLEGDLVAARVEKTQPFTFGPPQLLFRSGLGTPKSDVEEYCVTADGQRFLLRLPAPGSRPPELKLVLDWPALLRDDVPPVR